MNPIMTILGVLLAVSLAGNALVGSAYLEARDRANLAERARKTAADAAEACSRGVVILQEAGKRQREEHDAAIEKARQEGMQAGRRAGLERNRPQAVPGDVCASATVETREWLQRRQGGTR